MTSTPEPVVVADHQEMPAVFFGHGTPMNALDRNRYTEAWGLGHGTWSVLLHAFPTADIPVVQLSVNTTKPSDYHLELSAALVPLRKQGILVAASGNVVLNLSRIDWSWPDSGFDWAHLFDEAVSEIMTNSPGDLIGAGEHDDFSIAAPTPDHFLPLLYVAGMAVAGAQTAQVLVDGCSMGSLSMTSYTLGCRQISADGSGGSLALTEIPADGTNV